MPYVFQPDPVDPDNNPGQWVWEGPGEPTSMASPTTTTPTPTGPIVNHMEDPTKPKYTGDARAYVQALIAKLNLRGRQSDPQASAIHTIVAALKQEGVNVEVAKPSSGGMNKGIMLNGSFVKLLDGNDNWIWQEGGDSGEGGGTAQYGVNYGPSPDPNFGTAPAPYSSTPWTGGTGEAPALPDYLASPYVAPTFTPPTEAEAEAEPGYLTRMAAGQRVLEASAAAKGSVLSGGTQKALARYGQEYGANEYAAVYSRAANTFGINAGLGLSQRQQNVSEFNDLVARTQQNYQNRYAQWLDENSRTLTEYTTNTAAKRNYETDYWSRLMDLYQGGQSAANASYQPGVA